MNLPVSGGVRRTSGANWPELPRVPETLRAGPDGRAYDESMQQFWRDVREQLDRVGTSGRDITVMNGGSTRIVTFGAGSGGGGGIGGRLGPTPNGQSPGGPVPRGPLDLGPNGQFGQPSVEGGVYLTRLDGTRVFYQPVEPSEGKPGDHWYDTDDKFRLYIFQGGKWVSVFDDVPSIEGTIGEFDARALLYVANKFAEDLLAETTNRAAAIVTAQTTLSSATSALATQFTVLNAEVQDPHSGLVKSHARITTEQTVRATADTALAASITTLEVEVDGAYAAIVVEQNARIAADGTITANLNTEVTARTNGDNALSASITTEQTARIAADGSLAAEYVLSTVTDGGGVRRVAGFRLTNLGGAGGASEFVVQVDKFIIVDTSGNIPTTPFKVTGGIVYIDKAVITEVTAGAILAGTISVAIELTAATITAGTIRSGASVTYASGTGFWIGIDSGTAKARFGDPAGNRMTWDGSALTVTGAINASSGTIGGLTIGPASMTSGSVEVYSTFDDGLSVGASGRWARMRNYTVTNMPGFLLDDGGTIRGSFNLVNIGGSTIRASLTTDIVSATASISAGTSINAVTGYQISSTTVIDSSRNIVNAAAGTFSGALAAASINVGSGAITGGATSLTTLQCSGLITANGELLIAGSDKLYFWTTGNGTYIMEDNGLQFWGDASHHVQIKGTDTDLKLAHNYTAGAPTPTGYLYLRDAAGTRYKIPAEAA